MVWKGSIPGGRFGFRVIHMSIIFFKLKYPGSTTSLDDLEWAEGVKKVDRAKAIIRPFDPQDKQSSPKYKLYISQ
jgi:hypothetical protein